MAIKKFIANKDNTITNAFTSNLITRAVDSNMGASDILEVFTIYAQSTPPLGEDGQVQKDANGKIINTLEVSRVILEFPVDSIAQAITSEQLPATGVTYYLNLYNAEHGLTLPDKFNLEVYPISKSWDEGIGLDMEDYSDKGASAGGFGSDWKRADTDNTWDSEGGDYIDAGYKKTFFFEKGVEDLSIDITDIVAAWLNSDIENYGLMIKLEDSREQALSRNSTYVKRFFARGTEYFYKKPCITAAWDSSRKDNRGNFFAESTFLPDADNTNVIYLDNIINGQRKNIPGVTSGGGNDMAVKIYSDSEKTEEITPESITVSNTRTGEYKASLIVDTEVEKIYVDWEDASGQVYLSEEIKVLTRNLTSKKEPVYVTNITNMKSVYSSDETATFRLYTRLKDWNPTIYTVSSKNIENTIVEDAYFRIVRVVDEEVLVKYGEETKMSYDKNGNYFSIDMSLLEPDYAYRIDVQYQIGETLQQQSETFKFRVE